MSPFGPRTTALQVVESQDLSGKLAIVTGGNRGLGAEMVRALAYAGAEVILTSRDTAKGEAKAAELQSSGLKGKIHVAQLDLSDLTDITTGAERIKQLVGDRAINYIILNAGVMACPYSLTSNGFESQIGVNVFGHHYLVQHLDKQLRNQAAPCRIVVLASSAHAFGDIDVEDLHFKRRKYSAWKAYGQSKLANILWAREQSKRYSGTDIEVFAVHPGLIFTDLWQHSYIRYLVALFGMMFTKTAAQGAATPVYAAIEPSLKGHAGAYLSDCRIDKPHKKEAKSSELQRRLYDVICQQINQALLDTNSQVDHQLHS